MSKAGTESAQEERALPEVDRIRDIIMGPQMRLYEQQFRRITTQIEQLGKQLEEIRATIDRQRADQEARTLKLQKETQQRLDSLEAGFATSHRELASRVEAQNTDLAAQVQERSAELRRQGQETREELTRAIASLEDDKTSRDHLGNLLVEMGTRLKEQAGIADLLGQLGQTG